MDMPSHPHSLPRYSLRPHLGLHRAAMLVRLVVRHHDLEVVPLGAVLARVNALAGSVRLLVRLHLAHLAGHVVTVPTARLLAVEGTGRALVVAAVGVHDSASLPSHGPPSATTTFQLSTD